MRALSLLAALAFLSMSGCDSGGSGGDDCERFQLRSGGTISADYGSESFRVSCYTVSVVEGRTLLIGYDISGGITALRTPITILIDGTTEGAYDLDGNGAGDDDDESYIQLGLGGDATSPAETGIIRVEEYSPTRLRGTFSFATLTGIRVDNGRFDVGVSGAR